MRMSNADIITQLRKDILQLSGLKKTLNTVTSDILPAAIQAAFPDAQFPLGAVHEFLTNDYPSAASTNGFIAGILTNIMRNKGVTIWISLCPAIFPPALTSFGISPEKMIFIYLKKEKEILWVMEEALKCAGLAAVVGEVDALSFTTSRRLQLAVEKSEVTGFVIRNNAGGLNTNACVTRWKITSLPSDLAGDMPGVGFPRWNAELLKVRNGRPGNWQVEFSGGRFRHISKVAALVPQQKKKTG